MCFGPIASTKKTGRMEIGETGFCIADDASLIKETTNYTLLN